LNLRFVWASDPLHIPRKTKKQKITEIQKEVFGKKVSTLFCNKVGSSKIYCKKEINVDRFKEFIKEGYYYLGYYFLERKRVFFLMDVGSPIFIDGEYYICPNEKTSVKLIKM